MEHSKCYFKHTLLHIFETQLYNDRILIRNKENPVKYLWHTPSKKNCPEKGLDFARLIALQPQASNH